MWRNSRSNQMGLTPMPWPLASGLGVVREGEARDVEIVTAVGDGIM